MVEADYRIASTSEFLLSGSLVTGERHGTFFHPSRIVSVLTVIQVQPRFQRENCFF